MDGETFSVFKDALAKIDDRVVVHLRNDGIVCIAVDPNNVRMGIMTYPCSVEEKRTFMVHATALKDISTPRKRDEVTLEITDDSMLVHIGRYKYQLALSPPQKTLKPPNIDYDAKVSMTPEMINTAITLADKIADYTDIKINENGITFSAKDELETLKVKYTKDELLEYNGGSAVARFSTIYLKDIVKKKKNSVVDLELKTNHPLHLMFKFSSGLQVEYYVAPRLEEFE